MANIRLLACKDCKTIEEIPDYEGPSDHDHLLSSLVRKHQTNEHPHIGQLFKIDAEDWKDENHKKEIAKRIAAQLDGGETGLGSPFYDLKNTFQADALACYNAHLRNPACSDYKSDSKRLTPGTAEERRAEGLPEYRSAQDRYLCEFCPVHSLVQAAARRKAGLD